MFGIDRRRRGAFRHGYFSASFRSPQSSGAGARGWAPCFATKRIAACSLSFALQNTFTYEFQQTLRKCEVHLSFFYLVRGRKLREHTRVSKEMCISGVLKVCAVQKQHVGDVGDVHVPCKLLCDFFRTGSGTFG